MNFHFSLVAESFEKVLLVIAVFVALYAPAWVALDGSQVSIYVASLLLVIQLPEITLNVPIDVTQFGIYER